MNDLSRRSLLQRAAALSPAAVWAAGGVLRAVDYDKPAPGSEKLTAEQTNGLMLFRWNNRAIAAYRALASRNFPSFSRLAGPVPGFSCPPYPPLPYPPHRGLWLGSQPLNGGDYWGD